MIAWYSKVRDIELKDESVRTTYMVTFETDNAELKREVEKYLQGIMDKIENSSEKPNNCETCRFELYCPEMCEGCCEWDSHYEPKDELKIKCPKCGRTDYIKDLEKDFGVKDSTFKYKCINCNTYIKDEPHHSGEATEMVEPQSQHTDLCFVCKWEGDEEHCKGCSYRKAYEKFNEPQIEREGK